MTPLILTVTIAILTLIALTIRLYRQHTINKLTEKNLTSRIVALEKELASLREKNRLLEQENTRFQEKNFEDYKKMLFLEHEFDRKKGVFLDKTTGKLICPRCLINKTIVVPLKTEPEGWKCAACRKFYPDPDFIPPPMPPYK